jgi:hypothetical protein
MTALDAAFFNLERTGQLLHVGSVSIADGLFPPVDNAAFKFFIVADLDNALVADAVILTVFQIGVTVE